MEDPDQKQSNLDKEVAKNKRAARVAFRDLPQEGRRELTSTVIDPREFLFDFPTRDTIGWYARLLKSDDPADVERVRTLGVQVTQAVADTGVLFKIAYHSPMPSGTELAVERTFSEANNYLLVEESRLM